MTTTATSEGTPEFGYNSNLYLASHLVRNAQHEDLVLALLALLNAAHNQADGYLSSELVRETIVQVIATGTLSVYTGIGKTEEQRRPNSFEQTPERTYSQGDMDAVLDRFNDFKGFAEALANLDKMTVFNVEDWGDVVPDPEPKPEDGPDYHADHTGWEKRNPNDEETDNGD